MTHDGGLTRRRALRGAVATGVTVPLVAACADDDATPGVDQSPTPTESGAAPADDATGADAFASTSEIAVGAAVVFADERVVVTQPSEGDFRAFGATCPHQGCLVSSSTDGEIPCACHFSRFSVEDGSVLDGPSEEPLPEVEIVVDGDSISLA